MFSRVFRQFHSQVITTRIFIRHRVLTPDYRAILPIGFSIHYMTIYKEFTCIYQLTTCDLPVDTGKGKISSSGQQIYPLLPVLVVSHGDLTVNVKLRKRLSIAPGKSARDDKAAINQQLLMLPCKTSLDWIPSKRSAFLYTSPRLRQTIGPRWDRSRWPNTLLSAGKSSSQNFPPLFCLSFSFSDVGDVGGT